MISNAVLQSQVEYDKKFDYETGSNPENSNH